MPRSAQNVRPTADILISTEAQKDNLDFLFCTRKLIPTPSYGKMAKTEATRRRGNKIFPKKMYKSVTN